ncbi:oligosaccharide flippase family protein [Luteibacter sp. UNCMF366Tsu5.1]|uniref:oligosaccharide flippase family protein n=1 Tax=Luteibacter sp. UNCMF366Tsu5.1 TaxID=1502758 RepID=UPI0009084F88|nr:oligosaccharide flippase family protein [Luteibacter sp. UNCMF366Tsu5.1]SFW21270.1 Membrane protein involved in the export of O-antigen and teichoic acid [Luteibacter sp. UNCMF366Tsu5.1]
MNRRLAVLRSVGIVTVSTYIEYALGLLMSVWIARSLGPADFGRYAFTIWLCGWLIVCSNHALTTSSTKFIAEADGMGDPNLGSHLAARFSRIQTVSSAIVIALFVAVACVVRPSEWEGSLLPVMALVVVAVVAKANYAMLVAIGKGQERFEPEAIATVVGGIVGMLLVLAAMLVHAGLVSFVALFTLACLLLNVINRLAYRHYCRPYAAGAIPPTVAKRVNRHLRLTAGLVLMGSFRAGTIEVFLLTTFTGSVAVGYFAIAGTLTRGAVQLFSVGLTSTLLPYMAKTFGESGTARAARFLSEATRFYWAVGVAIAGLGVVTTPEIVRLMYGTRYVDAIPAIEATLVLGGLLLIGNGIAAFQTVVDRQDDRIRIAVVALVANLVLGVALVPPLGLAGAVLTYAGTRIVEMALAIHYLRKATSGALPVAAMSRLFAVGLVATLAAWAATAATPSRLGFIVGAVTFMALYVPGSLLVRYWTTDDVQLMTGLGRRLGPPGRALVRVLHAIHPPVAKASS